MSNKVVLIVGTGPGLSASFARLCAAEGRTVALAARDTEKLADLAAETRAATFTCDAGDPRSVDALFEDIDAQHGPVDLVVYNPSYRVRGPFVEVDRAEVLKTIMISCYGGFLVGQAAARRMLQQGHGTILFTGASASVKGYPQSASFAMGKFGLRGLAQSMARELAPKNLHVAHFVIDGGIGTGPDDPRGGDTPDSVLDPDAIARTYWDVYQQHRSAWTWEVELRPWTERF